MHYLVDAFFAFQWKNFFPTCEDLVAEPALGEHRAGPLDLELLDLVEHLLGGREGVRAVRARLRAVRVRGQRVVRQGLVRVAGEAARAKKTRRSRGFINFVMPTNEKRCRLHM